MRFEIQKQNNKKRLHAIERIEEILDKDTFCEMLPEMSNIEHFGMDNDKEYPYDGVICGYGNINGVRVYIYSQDITINGGTVGLNHAKKIVKTIELAIKTKCPIIGINDSGGARLQEGVHSLAGYGEIFKMNTLASGYITQISIIAGNCAGGAAYSPGLSDFIFMIDNTSCAFITGPKVIEQVTGEKIEPLKLGGAELHSKKSGVANFSCKNEFECYKKVRNLVSMLFLKVEEGFSDTINSNFDISISPQFNVLSIQKNKCYDIHSLISVLTTDFLEISSNYASNIVVGFAHIHETLVGIVANQPQSLAGAIDINASEKAARFIRYCDCFEIPILTLVDTPGFFPSIDQEKNGLIRHGSKLLYAYSESTVPKITLIVRKAYGGAYIAMGSKHLGADKVFCYQNAEIAIMGAKSASAILCRENCSEKKQEFEDEYEQKYINVKTAIKYGYVDEVISQEDSLNKISLALKELKHKTEFNYLNKKHGNIPL